MIINRIFYILTKIKCANPYLIKFSQISVPSKIKSSRFKIISNKEADSWVNLSELNKVSDSEQISSKQVSEWLTAINNLKNGHFVKIDGDF